MQLDQQRKKIRQELNNLQDYRESLLSELDFILKITEKRIVKLDELDTLALIRERIERIYIENK